MIVLVFDGVKCGDGRACKNRRCVPVAEISSPACPSDCNGHGNCTQKGTCFCNQGYAPPACINLNTTKTPTGLEEHWKNKGKSGQQLPNGNLLAIIISNIAYVAVKQYLHY